VAGPSGFHWPGPAGSFSASLPAIVRIWARYLGLLLLPVRLLADYSFDAFPLSAGWADPRAIAAAVLVAAFAVAAIAAWKRARPVGFFLVWIGIALLPVAQLVPHHELLSEHNLYLPSVGACLAGAFGFGRAGVRPLLVATLALFATLTVHRNATWHDERSFAESTIATAPRCARAHFNLARVLADCGDLAAARTEIETVAAIGPGPDPASSRAYVAAQSELSRNAEKRGALAEAEERLRSAIAASPREPVSYLNLAGLLGRQGRFAEAAAILEDAVSRGMREEAVLRTLALARNDSGSAAAEVIAPLAAARRAATGNEERDSATAILLDTCERSKEEELAMVTLRALGREAEARPWRARFLRRVRSEGALAADPSHPDARRRALAEVRAESQRCDALSVPAPLDAAAAGRWIAHLRAHVRLALFAEREGHADALSSECWRRASADWKRLFGEAAG
jgi:tetratricopeptide (TPR) repeat protein